MKITLLLLATVMTAVVYGGLIDDVKHRVAWEAYKVSKNAIFFFFFRISNKQPFHIHLTFYFFVNSSNIYERI